MSDRREAAAPGPGYGEDEAMSLPVLRVRHRTRQAARLPRHHDEGLMRLDARYESTTCPCDFVWGPGAWKDASAWLEQEQPPEDEVDVLDRLFLVQRHNGRIYLPRSPDVVFPSLWKIQLSPASGLKPYFSSKRSIRKWQACSDEPLA